MLGGEALLHLLYGPRYSGYGDLLVWLMGAAAAIYLASALGWAMTAARYFAAQIPLVLAVVGVSTAVCWWMVPTHGLRGAAVAMLIAALVWVAGSGVIVTHGLRRCRPR
jgi:O-antigen/teichoic acid export membrane protein